MSACRVCQAALGETRGSVSPYCRECWLKVKDLIKALRGTGLWVGLRESRDAAEALLRAKVLELRMEYKDYGQHEYDKPIG